MTLDPAALTFRDGLIPAIVRDHASGAVLTLAYMNEESLRRTLETGETWFWSRSRNELWNKGATSGNRQRVTGIVTDCDADALVVDVVPAGPACHTGAFSCFGDEKSARLNLTPLIEVLKSRLAERPEGSYSTYLFDRGIDKILKKIGEEATEVVIAAKGEGRERVISETADLLFHLSALLVHQGIAWSEVREELTRRES